MKIDKTTYKLKCIILSNPIYNNDYTAYFPCKILYCNNTTKQYNKDRIICKITDKNKLQQLKHIKKGQVINMYARLNKTIRITTDINEYIIQ